MLKVALFPSYYVDVFVFIDCNSQHTIFTLYIDECLQFIKQQINAHSFARFANSIVKLFESLRNSNQPVQMTREIL